MSLKAMVMAAGVGSRLDPLTKEVPTPLVPIANRPDMDILFARLSEIGVRDVVANTRYLAEHIAEHYKEAKFGINFSSVEEKTLSETAGGVKKCQFFFEKGEDFLVLSADGLSNADLKLALSSHKKSGAIASIGIKKIGKAEIPNFGVVVTDEKGFITEFQEKPEIKDAKSDFINTGIYVFNYKIFEYIPEATFFDFAKNVFPRLLQENIKINTFPVNEYWSDIGTINQYRESTFDLFDGKYKINHTPIIETQNGKYISDSILPESLDVIGLNTIGKNCKFSKNVSLENCILWDNVVINENVNLKNCIISSDKNVSKNLENEVI